MGTDMAVIVPSAAGMPVAPGVRGPPGMPCCAAAVPSDAVSGECSTRPIAENDRHADPPEVADPLAPLDRTEPPVGPRPIRRTRRGQWVTGIVVAVVIFVLMLGAYAFGGGNAVRQPDVTFPPGGAAVFLSVRSVTAAAPSMDVDVLLLSDPTCSTTRTRRNSRSPCCWVRRGTAGHRLADRSAHRHPARHSGAAGRHPELAVRLLCHHRGRAGLHGCRWAVRAADGVRDRR